MPFGAYDCKSACFFNLRCQFDVGTATCHVGSYGYCAGLSRFCNYLCLTLVQLGIQHVVLQPLHLEHSAKQLGYFNRGCTDKNRPSRLVQFYYLVDDSVVFFAFGFVDKVLMVIPDHCHVCGDDHYV